MARHQVLVVPNCFSPVLCKVFHYRTSAGEVFAALKGRPQRALNCTAIKVEPTTERSLEQCGQGLVTGFLKACFTFIA